MKRALHTTVVVALAGMMLFAVATPILAASQKNLTKVHFLNTGLQPAAQGKLTMIENKAQTFFMIKVRHMAPGDYDVVLDGAIVDVLTVGLDGKGRVQHRERVKGNNGPTALPYSPAGGQLEIQALGAAVLAASIPATPEEAFEKVEIEIDLANLGVTPGEAEAEFEERFGKMEFEVEIEGAAPGTYDLMVDGVDVADIVVDASGRGEVEFESHPSGDDGDEGEGSPEDSGLDLLLTFDPRGRTISIMQSATEVFSAPFPLTPMI